MLQKTKILVVDDDIEFADSLKDILETEGHEAATVNSGLEAVLEIENKRFDMVIADIKMPVMSGIELLKRIKKARPELIAIMMTAFSVEDHVNDVIEEGAFGVLRKPLNIERLIDMIEMAKRGGDFVMIADDDSNTRETLKDVFEQKGYSVSLASNSDEAIRITKEQPANIIFLDLKMLPLNGLEAYLLIKDINPKVAVVLMTAYRNEMKGMIEEALSKGAYGCLYKPFDPQEVLDMVEKIIKHKT